MPGPTVEILPGTFEPANYDKYITLKSESDQSITTLDIFQVH